jgi:hypothetical protein
VAALYEPCEALLLAVRITPTNLPLSTECGVTACVHPLEIGPSQKVGRDRWARRGRPSGPSLPIWMTRMRATSASGSPPEVTKRAARVFAFRQSVDRGPDVFPVNVNESEPWRQADKFLCPSRLAELIGKCRH